MNTTQLEEYMLADQYIRMYYGGVLPSNRLPLISENKPKIYIVNTDDEFKPGQHWIVLFTDDVGEYFDSLGKEPLQEFKDFLIINGPMYIMNEKQLQSQQSNLCGLYALYYAYFRCRGCTMKDILHIFTDNLLYNDMLVSYFYKFTIN